MALLRRRRGGGGGGGGGERGRWRGAGVEGGGGWGVKLYAHRAHCTDAYTVVSCTYSQNLDMQFPSLSGDCTPTRSQDITVIANNI